MKPEVRNLITKAVNIKQKYKALEKTLEQIILTDKETLDFIESVRFNQKNILANEVYQETRIMLKRLVPKVMRFDNFILSPVGIGKPRYRGNTGKYNLALSQIVELLHNHGHDIRRHIKNDAKKERFDVVMKYLPQLRAFTDKEKISLVRSILPVIDVDVLESNWQIKRMQFNSIEIVERWGVTYIQFPTSPARESWRLNSTNTSGILVIYSLLQNNETRSILFEIREEMQEKLKKHRELIKEYLNETTPYTLFEKLHEKN